MYSQELQASDAALQKPACHAVLGVLLLVEVCLHAPPERVLAADTCTCTTCT